MYDYRKEYERARREGDPHLSPHGLFRALENGFHEHAMQFMQQFGPLTWNIGSGSRGETEWVRNLRAARGGELRLGRQREPIGVEEVPDDAKAPILREYVRRWKLETGQFFDGVTAESPEAELRRIAAHHPVYKIQGLQMRRAT